MAHMEDHLVTNDSTVPARATRREWIGLAVLTLAALVYAMDLTVLNLAIPRISEELMPSSVQLLWILDIYGFLVAGLLITMGTLGDRIGRRKLLLAGAAGFAVASMAAAFSTSPEMLIGSRAVMGVAGATIAPSTLSLIFTMFLDPKQRTTAIAPRILRGRHSGRWAQAWSCSVAAVMAANSPSRSVSVLSRLTRDFSSRAPSATSRIGSGPMRSE